MLHFPEGRVSIYKSFGILLKGRFVLSPPFMCVFNHLYQCGLVDIYFILQIRIQYYVIYFVAPAVPALAAGSSSFGFCVPLRDPRHLFLLLSTSFLPSFLPCILRCSELLLYIFCPSLGICHFSKELWFFLLEKELENMVWALALPLVNPEVLRLRGFQGQSKETGMRLHTSVQQSSLTHCCRQVFGNCDLK